MSILQEPELAAVVAFGDGRLPADSDAESAGVGGAGGGAGVPA